MFHKHALTALLCATLTASAAAQTGNSTSSDVDQQNPNIRVEPMERTPVYRVNVVTRSTSAVDYRHRTGTKVDIKGTDLMPQVNGQAHVDSKAGRLEINANLDHLQPATTFGPEYLTYVLWAITPEGRPVNLGEAIPNNDGKVSMRVTTDLQAFGLIVTAEPYFAVTRPSNLVVAENIVRRDTKGWEQPISARFEALDRGQYTVDIPAAQLPATTADKKKIPLELLEARNAVAIAKAEGAQQYAPDALAKAQEFLDRGEQYVRQKEGRGPIGTVARYATQQAEDARVITIRKKEEERIANERKRLQDNEEAARKQAELDAQRAEQARQQAEAEAQRRAEAEQQRQSAEQARLQAEQAAQQAAQERAAAEQARQQALAQQQQLEQQRLALQQQLQQSEQQREEMRQRLLTQLNQVLQTKDTARGLIVNMSDVLFDFNKATLRPGARERLARVAGIILAYPDLKLQIEGHTDSIGSDQYNQQLSEKRADAVRDYLVSQGVNSNAVVARGLGKADPVASNQTAQGRQMNRRVELVVSGQSIEATGRTPASSAGSPGTTATGTRTTTTTVPVGTSQSTYSTTTTTTTPVTTPTSTTQSQTPAPAATAPVQQPAASQPVNGQPATAQPLPSTTAPAQPASPQQLPPQ